MKQYFEGDSYVTPPDTPRATLHKVFFGSRWGMYAALVREVFHSRALALRGEYDDEAWAAASYYLFSTAEGCGARFDIRGFDNIRAADGPVVFISNHMSTLETLVFPVLIVPIRRVTFVVKEQLVQGPMFGPIMSSRNPVTVTRTDPRRDLHAVLTEGPKRLGAGLSVIVFPQATRSAHFDPKRFNSLGVKLALRAGTQIIPVAIKTDFWSNGKILRGFGPLHPENTVHIEFGRPEPVTGGGKSEHRRVVNFIAERLERWTSETPD